MESTPSEEAEGQAIVRVLAAVLERLVTANAHIPTPVHEQTRFHAQRAPAIGILQYLERIHKYASCSKECFILALIYIDRLIQRNNFILTELNVHRVVITAVLLAAKFFDDAYYNNAYYAKVGGVLVEEMNNLETQFLFKIDFSLRVLPEVFDRYSAELTQYSTPMVLHRLTHSPDEDLMRAPQALEASRRNCDPRASAEATYQAHMLQTCSQSELEYSLVYSNLSPTPMNVKDDPVLFNQHRQLDQVYPFQALEPHVYNNHQAHTVSSEQDLAELDLLYKYAIPAAVLNRDVTLSPPIQEVDNGFTQSRQVSDIDPVYSSPAIPLDGSYAYYYPIQATNDFSQHANYISCTETTVSATTHEHAHKLHHHPEITPSPPSHHSIDLYATPATYQQREVGYSTNHLHSLPYLKSSSSAAPPTSLLPGHYYATPADAALAMHHQQHLVPSRPIAIGNHVMPHENHWSYRLSIERSASASGSA